jgi:cytochrome b6-f complex iron-sulfur subunit
MAEAAVSAGGLTRREFLYYIWTASLALFAVQFTGLLVWFMLPRFREGEFGGTFTLPIDTLPDVNAPPFNFPDGRFWLVNLNDKEPNELMYSAPDDGGRGGHL